MSAFQLSPSRWVAILAAFFLFFLVISGEVRYTSGDSRYALLGSQAILEHGSWRLDEYVAELPLSREGVGPTWTIHTLPETHHAYYDYPVGTSVFSLPIVAVAMSLGMRPLLTDDDARLQMFIAAIILVVIFVLLWRLGRLYLDDWAALMFSLLFLFGTSLMSALGTALWSSDFQTLFLFLVVLELAEHARGRRERVRGGRLGFLMFAAYICRPTTMAFIPVVLAYLVWKERRALPWMVGVMVGFFGLFVGWCLLEMGTYLPRYYTPGNWKPYGEYVQNFWAILVGPARGLFSFTPVLLLGLGGWAFRKVRQDRLYLLMWIWILLQTVMILRSKNPWGGWCYGPRFYAELMPGFALTLLMTLESVDALGLRWRRLVGGSFLVLSCFGVFVHTYQGLYSTATTDWNGSPNIDVAWANVRSDWRYPQFLASRSQLLMRFRENEMAGDVAEMLDAVPSGGALLCASQDAMYREIFAYWNRRDVLHRGKPVFNSVAAIHRAGFQEFWYVRDLDKELRGHPWLELDPLPPDSIMGPDSTMLPLPHPVLGHARLTKAP